MTMLLLVTSLSVAAPAVPLAEFRAIVVADEAPVADRTAAAELAHYLEAGGLPSLPVVNPASAPTAGPLFLVGDSPLARQVAPDLGLDRLGPDGIALRSSDRGLVLAGTPPRGTLYAVYSFLEDSLGVRWWTSTEQTVPNMRAATVPVLALTYTPRLRVREAFYRDALKGVFAARSKCNGHFATTTIEYGGHDGIIGWCHTAYPWLPPSKYFADHPDWYALVGGERRSEGAQLCFTNTACQAEMAKSVLAQIAAHPGPTIISVSQNDCAGWCECERCTAVAKAEGSQSGPLLQFVNAVAAEVAKVYPQMLVETLAYQGSRGAPKTIRPADNVVIRLCSIEGDFGQPLRSGERNATFAKDMADWSAIAPQLFVWNYVTNFANYLLPHPNLTPLADDIRYFVDNRCVGLFEQGDTGSSTGDFVRLRAWLLSHLMWDPRRDEAQLTDEFLRGYYGDAAPHLAAYLRLRESAREASGVRLGCYRSSAGDWMDLTTATESSRLFDAAEEAVAGQPELLARVQRERLPLTMVWLQENRRYRKQTQRAGLEWAGPTDLGAAAKAWLALHERYDVGQVSEGRPFQPWADHFVEQFGQDGSAAYMREVSDTEVEWQEGAFRLANLGEWVTLVDDAAASNGTAARMPGTHTQWAVQLPIGEDLDGETWHVYCRLRVEPVPGQATERAIDVGIYDAASANAIVARSPSSAEVGGTSYVDLDLGPHKIGPGYYVWVAPKANPDVVTAVFVDRFWATKVEE